MKKLALLYLLFVSVCVLAQNKEVIAIKIYLEAAETGKNIPDAKVTLEGFEIPEIVGKYDKKGKYYYFTEIPKGYNTVMAYHKKYNEKGFQNTAGLPGELKLKLYTPFRIRIPKDSLNYYKEDHTKLTVLLTDAIFSGERKKMKDSIVTYFIKNYEELELVRFFNVDFFSNGNLVCLRKKNGKNFMRFNDPVIKKLTHDNNVLMFFGALLQTKILIPEQNIKKEFFLEDGKPNYISMYVKYINYDDSQCKDVEQSGVKVSSVYRSYCEKLNKGLLTNNIYKVSNKELDSLYAIEEKAFRKEDLYLFNYNDSDTLINNRYASMSIDLPNIAYLPYYLVSNILKCPELKRNYEGKFILNYKNERNEYWEKYQFRMSDIIGLEKKNDDSTVFMLKNNIASPFGMMDLIEHYNQGKEKIYQNIVKNIKND